MSLRSGLLSAVVVVLTSAPAFACHRHLFFRHHCRDTVPGVAIAPLVIPLPVPHVVPVPVPMYYAQAPAPVVYTADADFPPPPMVVAQPVYVAPLPPPPLPPPPPAPAPARVVVAAPVVVVQQPPPEDPYPLKRVAVKYAPGLSAVIDTEAKEFGPASFVNSVGAEFRISKYFALIGGVELRSGARAWQIPGLKVSLFPNSRVHPFASASLAINQADGTPSNRVTLGVMASAGLDITLFRWLFLTAEARYAVTPGNCCALPRVTGLVGVGVQFF